MSACHNKNIVIEDTNPDIKKGLSSEQVSLRIEANLVNKTKMIAGKTYWEIIRTDVLTFFNIMLLVVAGFMVFANLYDGKADTPWYDGLFFLIVLILNVIISLYQDLKAKHLMNKLKVITTPKARVIRDGELLGIKPDEIVLHDIIVLKAGDQIPSDSMLLDQTVLVNESMLTGEGHNIVKNIGDTLFSGSYITSGSCRAKVIRVGKENYIESITEKAKSFSRNPSHILKSLKVLFRYLGVIIIGLSAITIAVYAGYGHFNSVEGFAQMIRPIAGVVVAMVPAGLYLLSSVTLASGVLSLYRKKANVQDFYSIEMLARSDILCVDKTGTITDGNINVKKVEIIGKSTEQEVAQIINSLITATKDENVTARALKEYFGSAEITEASVALPFSSENKYSGFSTKLGITYIIGALEFMNVKNKDVLLKQSEEYTSKGYRLLILAKGKAEITGNKYDGDLEAIAFVVLQDHIKEDALETFKWFQDNGVKVKVISGDNALTVSEIAHLAGIDGAEKYISLEGKSIEEVKGLANDYVVFGRVTPEQKEALVIALKEADHVVAMVGDGINDILALKRADCSIAMNSGSLSARNVSHVVLMEDNFSTMPAVVGEGRRVINNLQRTGSLFLTKTFYAIATSIIGLIVTIATHDKYIYPFSTDNLLLWETFGIGLAAFFIALEPDSKPINKGFLSNILKKAIPSFSIILFSSFVCYFLFILQTNEIVYTGVYDYGVDLLHTGAGRYGATAMAIMCYSFISLFVLYMTCRPLSLYRGLVLIGSTIALVGFTLLFALRGGDNILNIDYDRITGDNWMAIIVISASVSIVTLFIYTIVDVYKKYFARKKDVKHED